MNTWVLLCAVGIVGVSAAITRAATGYAHTTDTRIRMEDAEMTTFYIVLSYLVACVIVGVIVVGGRHLNRIQDLDRPMRGDDIADQVIADARHQQLVNLLTTPMPTLTERVDERMRVIAAEREYAMQTKETSC